MIYNGKVTRINGNLLYVNIPDLGGEFGPMSYIAPDVEIGPTTSQSAGSHTHTISNDGSPTHNHGGSTGSAGSHTHTTNKTTWTAKKITKGDRVIVAQVGLVKEDLVVLGKLA